MKLVINENTKMKIVGESIKIFDDGTTPNGFTCAILLDASHMSCHSYSDTGLLAVDVFTCGNNDPSNIIDKFFDELKQMNNNTILINKRFVYRFPL